MSARATLRVGLIWAMGLAVVGYTAGLFLHGGRSNPLVDVWLAMLSVVLPTAVCWLAVTRVGFRRWEIPLAATAMTSYAAGNLYYTVMLNGAGSLPFPSLSDVGYLGFLPLMVAALAVVSRHGAQGRTWSVWLDCAVGSLGAASVLAVLLSPVLASAMSGSLSLASVVAVAYPMLDLLIVATVTGIIALGTSHKGGPLILVFVGLMIFAAGDVVYALRVNAETYLVGTPLDAVWSVGLALVALWVDGAARQDDSVRQQTPRVSGVTALVVSSVATLAGMGVLVAGTRVPLSTLAVALAAVTLLAAAARTQLSYRQLVWMADLRRQDATTDDLTGLPNRRALYAEGHARLVDPRIRRQALLMLDLDKFKQVNDSLGHHAGDMLLIQVASRLLRHLREGDVLARLGGDEFAVLLENAAYEEATDVAVKLRAALAEPFAMEDIPVHISVSVGIALFPDDGPDLGSLLRKADIAMYKAKASGNGHHVYRGVDDADQANRLQTVQELRTALVSNQLVVHYQPKIDLRTSRVSGVEALVRWDHPTRGLLYPDAFLSLVEEADLMRPMTQMVLAAALDQVVAWQREGQPLTVAVNLSASSLADTDLPERISSMLTVRNLAPDTLRLEITEEFLMTDRDRAWTILTQLRHNGIQISIDDFGTGYSSLAYLRDLPIDELKLDRSFIFPMADDARAAALVASTVDLAHSLGLRMVAEGVETEVAYTELARLGCDEAQGYFIFRPVPAVELDFWLNTRGGISRPSPPPLA